MKSLAALLCLFAVTAAAYDCPPDASAPINGTAGSCVLGGSWCNTTCLAGYTLSYGSHHRTCLPQLVFSPISAVCSPTIYCDVLSPPAHGGVYTSNNNEFPSESTYWCESGYYRNGSEHTSCDVHGKWPAAPTCPVIACPSNSSAPINGKPGTCATNGPFQYGQHCTMSCNSGYYLFSGWLQRVCQYTNWLSPVDAVCLPNGANVTCPPLTNPVHGRVNVTNNYKFPANATYSCNAGYVVSEPHVRTCGPNGTWSGRAAVCTGITCTAPRVPAHGHVSTTNNRTYPSNATWWCDSGYERVGPAKAECRTNGNWSNSGPNCVPHSNSSSSSTGGYSSSSTGGWSSTGSGNSSTGGWSSTGSGNSSSSTGGWSSTGHEGNSSSTGDWSSTGHEGNSSSSTGDWSSTGHEGNSSSSSTGQGGVVCPYLSRPANGGVWVTNHYHYPATAYFSCNSGYTVSQPSVLNCTEDGHWSGPPAVCTAIKCKAIRIPTHGHAVTTNNNTYPSNGTWWCDFGYDLIGPSTAYCKPNGNWSSTGPICVPSHSNFSSSSTGQGVVVCPYLSNPLHGRVQISNHYEFPSTALYTCGEGFRVTEPHVLNCTEDGQWSDRPAVCRGIDCDAPHVPAHGFVSTTNNNTFPSVAVWWCAEGYWPLGSTTAYCMSAGYWTGHGPTCVPTAYNDSSSSGNGTDPRAASTDGGLSSSATTAVAAVGGAVAVVGLAGAAALVFGRFRSRRLLLNGPPKRSLEASTTHAAASDSQLTRRSSDSGEGSSPTNRTFAELASGEA